MKPDPYPLAWPALFPRTARRERSQFKTGLSVAIENVTGSVRRFAADSGKPLADVVISSNCTLGVDKPADPGVAVWFTWDGMQVCIPVDRYATVPENLQAIHHILEARRVELRHGTLALVRAALTGFKALPAPPGKSWRQVMDFNGNPHPTKEELQATYRLLSSLRHPDKPGGSNDAMAELNRAYDEARAALGFA